MLTGGANNETGEYFCWRCGHKLIVSDQYDLRNAPDEGMVTLYHCPHCTLSYEVVEDYADQEQSPYFKEQKQS